MEEDKAQALRQEREARKARLAMERQLREFANSKGEAEEQLEEERKKNVANMGLVRAPLRSLGPFPSP